MGLPGCFHHESRSRQIDGSIHGFSSLPHQLQATRRDVPITPPQASMRQKIWNYGVAVEQIEQGRVRTRTTPFHNPSTTQTVDIVTSGRLPKTVILRRLRWNDPPRRVPRSMHGRSAAGFSITPLLALVILVEGPSMEAEPRSRDCSRVAGSTRQARWLSMP